MIKAPLKEQLYLVLGLLLWLLYFNLSVQDWTSFYTPIAGVVGYLTIWFTSRSVWGSMNSRSEGEPEEEAAK